MMKKLFGNKKETMVSGMLYLKYETLDQIVDDLVYINTMLGNDIYETSILAETIANGAGSAIHVPVTTTEKVWKKLKSSKIKLIATSETKVIMNTDELEVALV